MQLLGTAAKREGKAGGDVHRMYFQLGTGPPGASVSAGGGGRWTCYISIRTILLLDSEFSNEKKQVPDPHGHLNDKL